MFLGRRTIVNIFIVWAMMAGIVLGGGCAYYNMLYNAKVKYKEADKIPTPKDGKISRQKIEAYNIAIEKAEAMIEKHPNSRHVDDAYILIASAQFEQEDYEAAIATVDTLLLKLPKSDKIEHARFIKGHATYPV